MLIGPRQTARSVRCCVGLEFAKEPFVVRSILEIAAATEHQRLIDGSLESVMALLGVSILMGLAGVDGLSFQAVVGQQAR